MESRRIKVLFVCTGNICRSPMAEAVFRRLVARRGLAAVIEVDSAGTHGFQAGKPLDPRARAALRRRGIDFGGFRARRVEADDFRRFDHILVMEEWQREELLARFPRGGEGRLRLLLDFAPRLGMREVPDPYFGDETDFEVVLDFLEEAARGLLDEIDGGRLSGGG